MAEPRGALVVIVGPTASGKSDRGLDLAAALDGEVVSADSMQVYKHFDVGTGKLPLVARRGIEHHLIDVCEPAERFCAASFVARADEAIGQIVARGRIPVVVGGTGLYVRALLKGLFRTPPPDPLIRSEHEAVRRERGVAPLYRQLQQVDPDAAQAINPNDFVRISRALEVFAQLGEPISVLQRRHAFAARRYPAVVLGIAVEPDALRRRIEARVDVMMEQGWLDEVEALVAAGHGETHPMGALGYRQLRTHLRGELDLADAVRQTKRDTWRFARRQRNWFSQEEDVLWRPPTQPFDVGDVRARLARLGG